MTENIQKVVDKNIDQLLIKINLKGDVSGTLPIFNYNYNLLNKSITKGGILYMPNQIKLTKELFKIKDFKDKEIVNKLREVFLSQEAIKNIYKENNDKLKLRNYELIKDNLEFILNLFFKENDTFYLNGSKFKIKNMKNLTKLNKNFNYNKIKRDYLLSKSCSLLNDVLLECKLDNIENRLIESYKEKEIKFIKKIDPKLSDYEVDKKAYKDAIEKYKKGNQNEQIKNFANEIIQKENKKNDYKRAGLNYVFDVNKGIILQVNKNIIDDIIIELDLIYDANIKQKKIHIERGNCKTKKNYIKNLWKKLTK